MQQGVGGDDLAVGWELPDGTLEQPMTASTAAGDAADAVYGSGCEAGIYTQTGATSVVEGGEAVFSVVATNAAPLTYRWLVNGAANGVNAGGDAGDEPQRERQRRGRLTHASFPTRLARRRALRLF